LRCGARDVPPAETQQPGDLFLARAEGDGGQKRVGHPLLGRALSQVVAGRVEHLRQVALAGKGGVALSQRGGKVQRDRALFARLPPVAGLVLIRDDLLSAAKRPVSGAPIVLDEGVDHGIAVAQLEGKAQAGDDVETCP
jgi:hypothetical protein